MHYRNAASDDTTRRLLSVADKKLAASIGLYAAEGEVEFVAEVFAALIAGRSLGDKVLDMYTRLGGIIP